MLSLCLLQIAEAAAEHGVTMPAMSDWGVGGPGGVVDEDLFVQDCRVLGDARVHVVRDDGVVHSTSSDRRVVPYSLVMCVCVCVCVVRACGQSCKSSETS